MYEKTSNIKMETNKKVRDFQFTEGDSRNEIRKTCVIDLWAESPYINFVAYVPGKRFGGFSTFFSQISSVFLVAFLVRIYT